MLPPIYIPFKQIGMLQGYPCFYPDISFLFPLSSSLHSRASPSCPDAQGSVPNVAPLSPITCQPLVLILLEFKKEERRQTGRESVEERGARASVPPTHHSPVLHTVSSALSPFSSQGSGGRRAKSNGVRQAGRSELPVWHDASNQPYEWAFQLNPHCQISDCRFLRARPCLLILFCTVLCILILL